ncbi:anti-sigma factor family protein [bacterium]
MNCESVRTLLNSFIDGETSELESRSISQHISSCESCAAEAKQYRRTRDLVSEFGAESAPDGLLNDIRMKMQKEPQKQPTSFLKYRGVMALAATFLIVILGGVYFGILKTGQAGISVDKKISETQADVVREEARLALDEKERELAEAAATPVRLDEKEIPGYMAIADAETDSAGETLDGEPAHPAGELERSDPRPVMDTSLEISGAGGVAAAPDTSESEGSVILHPPPAPEQEPAEMAGMEEILDDEYENAAPAGRSLRSRNEPMAEMPAGDTTESDVPDDTYYEEAAPRTRSLASRNEPMASPAPEDDEYEDGAPGVRTLGDRNEPMAKIPAEEVEYEGVAPSMRRLGEKDEHVSQAEVVREEMSLALNEKEAELAAEAAAADLEEEEYKTRGLSFAAATHERRPTTAAAITPVAYASKDAGRVGFNYDNIPSGSDVMDFVGLNSLTVQPPAESSDKVTKLSTTANPAGLVLKRKSAPGEINPGNFVRAANVFFADTPGTASKNCEAFIIQTMDETDDSQAAWRRNGNYFIVKGSFSTLAPLRVRLMEEFSSAATGTENITDAAIAASASSSLGIPPDYTAVLEVKFLPR